MEVEGTYQEEAYSLQLPFTKQQLAKIGYFSGRPQSLRIKEEVTTASAEMLVQYAPYLQTLKSFTAKYNDHHNKKIQGLATFFTAISCFKNLETLELMIGDNLNIGPEGCQEILKMLKTLQSLKNLSLHIQVGNQIGKQALQDIGQGIESMNKLESLKIIIAHSNKVIDAGIALLYASVGKSSQLKSLYLSVGEFNKSSEKGIIQLSQSLPQLKNLEMLGLIFNKGNMTKEGLIQLSQSFPLIEHLENLEVQIVGINQIDSKSMEAFCESLPQIKKLKQLNFFLEERLTQEMGTHLNNSLKQLTEVELLILNLSADDQLAKQIISLPLEGISQMKSLVEFSFTLICVSKQKSDFLLNFNQCLKGLPKLERFALTLLDWTNFEAPDLIDIHQGIANLTNLKVLSLQLNTSQQIQGDAFSSLGESLKMLTHLQKLTITISSNQTQESGTVSLINGISYLTELEYLRLEFGMNNQIRVATTKAFIEAFENLQKLQEFMLKIDGQNSLKANGLKNLNTAISKLKQLEKLFLVVVDPESLILCGMLQKESKLYPFQNTYFDFGQIRYTERKKYHHKQLESEIQRNLKLVSNNYNQMNEKGFEALFDTFNQIKYIDSLQFNFNQQLFIDHNALFKFASLMSQLTHIKSLHIVLTNKDLSEQFFSHLSKSFSKIKQLEELKIDLNLPNVQIIPSSQSLVNGISHLNNLKILSYIVHYHFDFEEALEKKLQDIFDRYEAQNLINAVQDFEDLESLEFSLNYQAIVSSKSVINFDTLINLQNLKTFILHKIPSQLPIHIIQNLQDNLQQMKQLENLTISTSVYKGNYESFEKLSSIVQRLNNLTQVKFEVNVSHNQDFDPKHLLPLKRKLKQLTQCQVCLM